MQFLHCLALTCLAWPGDAPSALKISPAVVDLGTVAAGPMANTRLELHNSGAQPLDIVEVNRSCGCLAPRLDKLRLAPGEKTTLDMTVRTLGHVDGPHSWNAVIVHRVGDRMVQQTIVVKASIRNEVLIQPAALALHVADVLHQEIRVHDRRAQPFKIRSVRSTFRQVNLELKEDQASGYRIILQARGADLPEGRHDGFVDIYTDDAQYAHLQIPLTLTKAQRSDILVTPETIRVRPGQVTAPIRVRSRSEKPLTVSKVEASDPGLSCTWAVGEDGSVTMRVRAGQTMSAGNHEVRVLLSAPEVQIVRLQVQVEQ